MASRAPRSSRASGRVPAPGRRDTAGVLLYRLCRPRRGHPYLAVLLVRETWGHDAGTWGIPKGRIEPGEEAEHAARRELREETGILASGSLVELGAVRRGRPRGVLRAFGAWLPVGVTPRPAYPEVDAAEVVAIARARQIIHPEQRAVLDALVRLVDPTDLSDGRAAHARLDAEVAAALRPR